MELAEDNENNSYKAAIDCVLCSEQFFGKASIMAVGLHCDRLCYSYITKQRLFKLLSKAIRSSGTSWAEHVTRMRFIRTVGLIKIVIGKPADKRPLWRNRCRWEDNIKMDFKISRARSCGLDSTGSE
jgi:hypothetical protein